MPEEKNLSPSRASKEKTPSLRGRQFAASRSQEETLRWVLRLGSLGVVFTAVLNLVLFFRTGAWQMLLLFGGQGLALFFLILAWRSMRREDLDGAGYWTLAALLLAFGIAELAHAGLTIYLTVGGVILTLLVGGLVLPRQWKVWLGAGILFLAFILLANIAPFPRYNTHQLLILRIVTPLLVLSLTLTALWRLFRLYQHLTTIRERLLFSFIAVVSLPILLLSFVTAAVGYVRARDDLLAQLESVALLKESEIESWLETLQTDLSSVAREWAETQQLWLLLESTPDSEEFDELHDELFVRFQDLVQRSRRFEETFLLSPQGQVILSSDREQEGANYRGWAFFRSGLEERKAHVVWEMGRLWLIVAQPVTDIRGDTLGVLVGRVDINRLNDIVVRSPGLGRTGEVYLISPEQARLTRLRSGQNPTYIETQGAEAAVEERTDGSGIYPNYEGKRVVGVYHWLPALDVALIAEQQQLEALAPIYILLGVNFLTATISVAVAIAASLAVTRSIATPLANLAQTAHRVTEGDLLQTVKVETEDEIGAVAHAFNEMTSQLRELIASLERRVLERTQELERRTGQMEAAAQVAREAASIRNLDDLLNDTVHLISSRFGLYHAGIFLIDEEGEYAVLQAANSSGGQRMLARGHRLRVGEVGIVGYVTGTGEPRIALDVGADAVYFDNPDLPLTRSEMALPLKVGDRVIGALDVQSAEEAAFTEEDISALAVLADQLSVAIENARLVGETRRALAEVETLYRQYLQQEWQRVTSERGFMTYEYTRMGTPPLSDTGVTDIDRVSESDQAIIHTPEDGNGQKDGGNGQTPPFKSALTVPITLRGQVIGVIDVHEAETERQWNEQEIDLVEAVGDQMAQALENVRLFEEAHDRAEEMAILNEMSQALSATLNVEEVVNETYQGTSRLLKTENFYIALYDVESDLISFPFTIEYGKRVEQPARRKGRGLTEYVLETRQPLLLRENAVDQLEELDLDVIGEPSQSWLGVPLMIGNRVLGVIAIQDDVSGTYNNHDKELLTAVASQTAIALQNAYLFEETQSTLAETETLYQANRAIAVADTANDALHAFTDHVVAPELERCVLALLDPSSPPDDPVVEIAAAWEPGVERSPVLGNRWNASQIPLILEAREPLVIPDVANDPRVDERSRHVFINVLGIHAIASIPLTIGEHVIGWLLVESLKGPYEFSSREIRLYRVLAGQAAVAIERIRLFEETQRRATQLETAAEVSQAASSILSLDELLPQAVELIRRRFDLYYVGIFLTDEADEWAILRAGTGEPGRQMIAAGHKLEVGGTSMIGQCTARGEARIALDVGTEQIHRKNPYLPDTRSEMALPLISRGHTIGSMTIQSEKEAAFTTEDITAIQTMADQLANAIENARLFSETEQSLSETRELYEASRGIGAAVNPEDVRAALVEYASHTGADAVRLLLFEYGESDEPTHIVTAEGWTSDNRPTQPVGTRLSLDSYPLTDFMSPNETITVEDVYIDPRVNDATRLLMEISGLRAFAIIPVVSGDRQVGGVLVGHDQPHTFEEKEIRGLWTLSGQAAIALENLRLLDETRRRARELEAINEIGRTITSVLDRETLIRQIVDTTKIHFDHYFVSILMVEGQQVVLQGASQVGDTGSRLESEFYRFDLNRPGLVNDAIRTAEPVLVNDVLDEPRYISVTALKDVRSELVVPIEVKGRVIGALDVQSHRRFAYDQTDVALLQSLASQVGVAIENARLFEQTEAEAQRRALINEVLQAAAASLDPQELISQASRIIARQTTSPVAIFTWDPDVAALQMAIIRDSVGDDVTPPQPPPATPEEEPVMFRAIRMRQSTVVNDAATQGHAVATQLAEHLDFQDIAYIPLMGRNRILGLMALGRHAQQPPLSESRLSFLEIIAANLSVAMENTYLYQEAVETAERLAEVDRLKSQFLANMSHELRTPLNSIIGFSRVILKGIDGPLTDLQRQDLEAIYGSGQHLLGLINDILDISKIEAGKMELAFESVEIAEIVKGVMSTAIALVKDKSIELQQAIPPDLPDVVGDSRRIRQVLLNLVSNAAKFTEEGFIRVSAQADPTFVTLSVRDSGIGIPEDKLESIFEAFTQVDSSATRKFGGTGLGLTITRSLVELHGGEIWVESEFEKGTTFHFTVPIEGPEALKKRQEEEQKKKQEAALPNSVIEELEEAEASKVVLCVDDNEGVLTLFERYLSKQGYKVIPITNPSEVVEEAKRIHPYAITLDVMMPGMDGWQVIEQLKSDPDTRSIPVLMCTIVNEQGRGMTLGAADYLVKPILEQDLLDALERLNREGGRHLVLVVDDLAEDRGLLRRLIESQPDYEVVEAASGEEAIALVQQLQPHIIVLDLMMPEMDGFSVLESLKAEPSTRSIPIIVVTAKEISHEERQRLNHQIEALIQKGMLDRDELLEDVSRALSKMDSSTTPPDGKEASSGTGEEGAETA